MNDYQGRVVLVTGGAGFIGSHLVEEFVRRGAVVSVVERTTANLRNLSAVADQVRIHTVDLAQDDLGPLFSGREFDLIVHTAANANVADSIADPRMDFERNALATLNLLEAMRSWAPRTRLLQTSTAAVYGRAASLPMLENDPTLPVSPYGVSKLASELYVATYASVYGFRAATLRLFSVYGPRLRRQVIYDLMRKVRDNPQELPIQGDGTQLRDFNYVTDVVAAFLIVAQRGRFDGEVYNVAAEQTVTIDQVAKMVCERMGAAPQFRYSGQTSAGDLQRLSADISCLKNLGYRPQVTFADGLDRTVKWFREESRT